MTRTGDREIGVVSDPGDSRIIREGWHVWDRFETFYLNWFKIKRWKATVTQGKSDLVKH